MRFLERRDDDFDVVKSFLVVSMIVAHSFQLCYDQVYNKHLTYYVLIGFVLLSGLNIGSVYHGKLLTKPAEYSWLIISRALKLLGIFLFANIIILMLHPSQILQGRELGMPGLLFSAIFRDGGARFSFAVLVAISFTFVGSVALLCWTRRNIDLLLIGFLFSALWVIEITGHLDYYTIKMTIVGLIGVLTAKTLYPLDWEKTRSTLLKWYFGAWLCYITYQIALIIFDEEWQLKIGHYIIVTIFLLLAVYLTSFRTGLSNQNVLKFLNKSLAKHMLFAYLFHIILLRFFMSFISRGNMVFAIGVALCTLAITILITISINYFTGKYKIIDRTYSLVFK